MIGRRSLAIGLVALAVVAASRSALAFDGPLEAAAYGWLQLLDEGRFDDAWHESDPLLRDGVTQAEWTTATRKVRDGFGAVASRTVMTKDYHRQIDGGPDGNYFTLRIRTRTTDARDVVEIVTLTAGADQKYRPAAYGIKR